jgi:hypothetical protein
MSDGLESELSKLFDESRVEGDDFQVIRMAARAVEAVPESERWNPGRWVSWLGGLALCGLALVWALPSAQEASPPSGELSWAEYDEAIETYLDVGWNDGSLWADPLEGAGEGLSEEALLEEYAALLDDMQL